MRSQVQSDEARRRKVSRWLFDLGNAEAGQRMQSLERTCKSRKKIVQSISCLLTSLGMTSIVSANLRQSRSTS